MRQAEKWGGRPSLSARAAIKFAIVVVGATFATQARA